MNCRKCGYQKSKVNESRDCSDGDSIRRRRECLSCGHRFTTYERFEIPAIFVIKNNGRREMFDRDKVIKGINKACDKTKVTADQIDQLIGRVETELVNRGEKEVSSKEIGSFVMRELLRLDEVAYIRFASVYKKFDNVKSFERAAENIKNIK